MCTTTEKKLPSKIERHHLFATYFKKQPSDVVSNVQTIYIRLISQLDHQEASMLDVMLLSAFLDDFYFFANDCMSDEPVS